MSLRWGEHRGRTKSTAEISFQSSFYGLAIWLLLVHIYLFIYIFCFLFLFFGLNLNFFFFEIWEWIAKRANDVQKQIYISSLWTDRRAHIRAESCGYWCPLWQSTFRLTRIYLFILFFFLNMFIKVENFVLLFCVWYFVVISALWNCL